MTMDFIQLTIIGYCIATISFFWNLLLHEGFLFGFLGEWINKQVAAKNFKPKYENHKPPLKWWAKIMGGCAHCFNGQLALISGILLAYCGYTQYWQALLIITFSHLFLRIFLSKIF